MVKFITHASAPWVEAWSLRGKLRRSDSPESGHGKRVPVPRLPPGCADDALVFHGETQLDVLDVRG